MDENPEEHQAAPGHSWSNGLTPLQGRRRGRTAVAWVPRVHPGSEGQKGLPGPPADHSRRVGGDQGGERAKPGPESQSPESLCGAPGPELPMSPPRSHRMTCRQGLGAEGSGRVWNPYPR